MRSKDNGLCKKMHRIFNLYIEEEVMIIIYIFSSEFNIQIVVKFLIGSAIMSTSLTIGSP